MKVCFKTICCFVLGGIGCASSSYQGPKSDHFDGRKFFNPTGNGDKSIWHLFRWQFTEKRSPWPEYVELTARPQIATAVADQQAVFTFVNHATMLIQLPGINILIDPTWSERTSPLSWAGPKRVKRPGIEFDQLPKIDLVLVSHNHYDHLDVPTLKRLNQAHRPRFLIPLGDGKLLKASGIENYLEMDWWQSTDLPNDYRVSFVPARHWSGRGLWDRRDSLWGGFVISGKYKNVYYAGDAGYSRHFSEVREKFKTIDIALLPIGAYEPRWFMKDSHMNPDEAVQAHLDLGSKVSIGVHFGTFQLTNEAIDAPIIELDKALESRGMSRKDFDVMKEGETRTFQ